MGNDSPQFPIFRHGRRSCAATCPITRKGGAVIDICIIVFLVRMLFFHCMPADRHSDSTPDSGRVRLCRPPEGMRWSMTVLTSSSHRAGQGVSQDHFGSLIHHMVLEITLGSHFRLRSHFSENSVRLWARLPCGSYDAGSPTTVVRSRELVSCGNGGALCCS